MTVLVAMGTGGAAGPVPGANPVGRVPLLWSAGGDRAGGGGALGSAGESATGTAARPTGLVLCSTIFSLNICHQLFPEHFVTWLQLELE